MLGWLGAALAAPRGLDTPDLAGELVAPDKGSESLEGGGLDVFGRAERVLVEDASVSVLGVAGPGVCEVDRCPEAIARSLASFSCKAGGTARLAAGAL